MSIGSDVNVKNKNLIVHYFTSQQVVLKDNIQDHSSDDETMWQAAMLKNLHTHYSTQR